ncbi:hypothetical protein EDB81DRAFT_765840 [Dactylonectria macrodidyma]|uniref:Uncharacterized protein n=1 Tax=Dactylonectria macrodidyma TaxID=307937 RepID=A0A9P9DQQ9_9HYPO|nr:hypothetical protein EDB81DRAFT_765840 [Dactylonectria macrodidyma]
MALWDFPAPRRLDEYLSPIPAPSFWDPMMDADVTCLTGDTRLVGPIFKPMMDGVIPIPGLVEEPGTIGAGQPEVLVDCLNGVGFNVLLGSSLNAAVSQINKDRIAYLQKNPHLLPKVEWCEKVHAWGWAGLDQPAIDVQRSQTRRIDVVDGVDYLIHIPSADEPVSQRSVSPEPEEGIVEAQKMVYHGTRQRINQILGSCHMNASVWVTPIHRVRFSLKQLLKLRKPATTREVSLMTRAKTIPAMLQEVTEKQAIPAWATMRETLAPIAREDFILQQEQLTAKVRELMSLWQACGRTSRKDEYLVADMPIRCNDGKRMCNIDVDQMIERHLKREAQQRRFKSKRKNRARFEVFHVAGN